MAALYVGDTPNDVRAGLRAETAIAAVTTGPHAADELRDAGATVVLETLEDFPAWFTEWHGG
jgi:phosphoglycolate phosphatase